MAFSLYYEATWNITFDDVDLIFDSNVGWRFPTDEEYMQQKSNRQDRTIYKCNYCGNIYEPGNPGSVFISETIVSTFH